MDDKGELSLASTPHLNLQKSISKGEEEVKEEKSLKVSCSSKQSDDDNLFKNLSRRSNRRSSKKLGSSRGRKSVKMHLQIEDVAGDTRKSLKIPSSLSI